MMQSIEIYNLTELVKQIVRLSGDEASRGTVFPVDISNLEKGLYILKGELTKLGRGTVCYINIWGFTS